MLEEPEKTDENLVDKDKNNPEKQENSSKSKSKKGKKNEDEIKERKKLLAIYLLTGLIIVSIAIFAITFDFFPDITWGTFECTYHGEGEEKEILNKDYKIKRSYLKIYINGNKTEDDYPKFNSDGDFKVTIKIKDKEINLKKMFAETNIKTMKMNSKKDAIIKNMESSFENCEFLEKFEISGFDTSKVENMSKLFYNCKNLKEVDIVDMDTDDLESMDYMFANTNISEIKLTNFKISQLLKSKEVFQNCNNTKIIIKEKNKDKIDELNKKYPNLTISNK